MTLRVVSFKIEDYLLEQLDKYAIKNTLNNRSEAIRRAIEKTFNSIQDQPVVPCRATRHIDSFQFYPRSTRLFDNRFRLWILWLSILSKINFNSS